MALVFDILDEERRRLLELISRYKQMISNLPKGSLSKKRRWNREYYYLAYRDGNKVRFDYVGSINSESVQVVKQQLEQRKVLEEKLRLAKNNLAEVKQGLHGRK